MAEVRTLDRFFTMLDECPDRAFYGLKHVMAAHANQAIEALLITDELFRYCFFAVIQSDTPHPMF
jgi:protein pelota